MTGPLDDITVLEVANWVAAPSAGVLMADMGADVIKVEPLHGDAMRMRLMQPVGAPPADYPFQLDNRGKRSIAIAINDPAGADLLRQLADRADVVITNLLPERARRYGLDAATLQARNPGLVYAAVSAYGPEGPEADRSGYDQTAFFGRTGVMSLLGEPDAPPVTTRSGQGDHVTGVTLLAAVLAALRERDRTGAGQVVETSLVRVGMWTIAHDLQTALVDRLQPEKRARADAYGPMNVTYRCGDARWLMFCTTDQSKWPAFCAAVGRPELADDPRFATPADRFVNNREVIAIFDEIFASAPSTHWVEPLTASGVVWERVAQLPEVVVDAQLRAIGAFESLEHPTGTFDTVAAPFTMSASDVSVRRRAPEPGEHTEEVLREMGLDDRRVAELATAGVVGLWRAPAEGEDLATSES